MTDRIRLSALADELAVPFPQLFSGVCRTMPQAVDNDLTVSGTFADCVRQALRKGVQPD